MGTLTDAEKVDVRRFLGYPIAGSASAEAQLLGYRFFQAYGAIEYRLNNMAAEEETTLRAKLVELRAMDSALGGAYANLDTDSASVWVHNKREVPDRMGHFNLRRNQLAEFFGVPAGPGLANAGSASIAMVL